MTCRRVDITIKNSIFRLLNYLFARFNDNFGNHRVLRNKRRGGIQVNCTAYSLGRIVRPAVEWTEKIYF